MRDDLAAINIGKAEDDYKREFFWRSYRDIEMFLTRLLSKGPVEVSNFVADEATVAGNLTLGGSLEVGSIEVIGDLSVGDDATITGDLDVDGTITGNLTGNVTGNVAGNVTGNLTGNINGNTAVSGNLSVSGSASIVGYVTTGTAFISADVNAVLANTGVGNVYLRPNGYGSTVGQMTVASSGNATIDGSLLPSVTGTRNLGSTGLRWGTVYTSDLSLNNGIGDWTIVEGEDDLFITNNKTSKKYKFALIEV